MPEVSDNNKATTKRSYCMRLFPTSGFTLSELLVSLAILGMIVVFAIPKILSAQQNGTKIAILKEDIATIQASIYAQIQAGSIVLGSHACGTNSPVALATLTQLGKDNLNYTNYDSVNNTFYLANGSSLHYSKGYMFDYTVDWNGDAAPNTQGDDQILFYFNDCSGVWYGISMGRFGPNTTSANQSLYYLVFTN